MKQLFFGFNILAATFVQFDTQDNLYREAFGCQWKRQLSALEDSSEEYNREYELDRIDYKGGDAVRIFSTKKIKAVRLNNFPFSYKVKRVSPYEFIVSSKYFAQHFDGTDYIETAIIHY